MYNNPIAQLLKLIPNYSEAIILTCVVLFGATTNAFLDLKRARDKSEPYGMIDFGIALFVAAFSGMIFGFIAEILSFDGPKKYMIVGLGSFMGVAGVNSVIEILLDTIKAKIKSKDNERN